MDITFLGHQGWAIGAGDSSVVLVDPIAEKMGNGQARMPVWPNRKLLLNKLNIAAMIISHEHSDHFDVRTLCRLPFRGVVWISPLSSFAMPTLLRELGYTVKQMPLLRPFRLAGELNCIALPTEYDEREHDVAGLLFEEQSTRETFLTMIDGSPHGITEMWLSKNCPRRTVDNFTNNKAEERPCLSLNPLDANVVISNAREKVFSSLLAQFSSGERPKQVLVSGQGWSYEEDRAPLNHEIFAADIETLCEAARIVMPATEWVAAKPGRIYKASDIRQKKDSDFLELLKTTSREYRPNPDIEIRPYSMKHEIAAEDLAFVETFVLDQLATLLWSSNSSLFTALYELTIRPGVSHKPAFALRVKNGDNNSDFELDYRSAQFGRVILEGEPSSQYALGATMWASDLKLLIDAGEEHFLIWEASVAEWNHYPKCYDNLVTTFLCFSPRFRPQQYLEAYRRLVREQSDFSGGSVEIRVHNTREGLEHGA